MSSEYIESSLTVADTQFEKKIRPSSLSEFVGQDPLLKRLSVTIQAARKRNEPVGHTLFYGPPGLGKTTLATILAEEMHSHITVLSAPSIDKPGDLAGILTSLEQGDVLFIDEIHRLQRNIEEYLYAAMEDFSLDILLDAGTSARSVSVQIKPFTLVGATTRLGLLSSPLRSRFSNQYRLDYYTPDTLSQIVHRSAPILGVTIHEDAALEIASRARGTPRIANNLLKWIRDYAQIHHDADISSKACLEGLKMINIDQLGLDEMDKKFLSTIIEDHDGGPVGIGTLAAALGEDADTLAEVHEPYLIKQGLLKRTLRGREVTRKAYEHLRKEVPDATC